jgi:hypothetical protein
VAATRVAVGFGFGAFCGAGPTIAPSAVRPPQHSTNVEADPTAIIDTTRWAFDIRAQV